MLNQIGEGKSRNVYSLGKEYVLKTGKFNFKKFQYFVKKALKKENNVTFRDAIKNSSGIIDNLEEYGNSQMTDKIAEVNFTLFGILNIQKRFASATEIYEEKEDFLNKMSLLKTLILENNTELKKALNNKNKKSLTSNERKLISEYSDLFHFVDKISNYGVNEKGELILLDGGNSFIGKLLKDKAEEVFNILFQKK